MCPVSMLRVKLLPSSRKSSLPLVRRIVKSNSKEYFYATKGVSYTAMREEFKEYVETIVDDIANHGTHIKSCVQECFC